MLHLMPDFHFKVLLMDIINCCICNVWQGQRFCNAVLFLSFSVVFLFLLQFNFPFFRFTFEHLHSHLGETRGLAAVDADGLGQNNLTEAALAQRLPQSQPEDTHARHVNGVKPLAVCADIWLKLQSDESKVHRKYWKDSNWERRNISWCLRDKQAVSNSSLLGMGEATWNVLH